jgi:hypothetical protein
MKRRSSILKAAILLAVLIGLGALFLRTVRNAGSEPYTVRAEWLRDWRVVPGSQDPRGALLGLRPPAEFTSDLFRQVFKRTMASLSSPVTPQVSLVSGSEVSPGVVTPVLLDDLEAAARKAGLEGAPIVPRCLAAHRISEAGSTLEFYYVPLDLPGFDEFRQGAATVLQAHGSSVGFETRAVPVLLIAGTELAVRGPLPFQPDPDRDCVAPLVVE